MSFIGTMGVVAQQGNQAAAGSGDPTVATSESGNYNNAIALGMYDGTTSLASVNMIDNVTGSGYSSGTDDTLEWNVNSANNYQSGSSVHIRIFAYIREGGSATSSPTWSLHDFEIQQGGTADTLGGGATAQLVTSSYNQYQDNTLATRGYTGIGAYVNIDAGGGRGGLTWGSTGATMAFSVSASIGGDAIDSAIQTEITWVV